MVGLVSGPRGFLLSHSFLVITVLVSPFQHYWGGSFVGPYALRRLHFSLVLDGGWYYFCPGDTAGHSNGAECFKSISA